MTALASEPAAIPPVAHSIYHTPLYVQAVSFPPERDLGRLRKAIKALTELDPAESGQQLHFDPDAQPHDFSRSLPFTQHSLMQLSARHPDIASYHTAMSRIYVIAYSDVQRIIFCPVFSFRAVQTFKDDHV